MTSDVFVDASAFVAIISREQDHTALADALFAARRRCSSAVALYETVVVVASRFQDDIDRANREVEEFASRIALEILPIDDAVGRLARGAFDRFGKGRHRARLNLGDCFAYACAKRHGLALLFKGDDFIHTDIEPALRTGS